jgi:L-alanine-DL-glutamate epimerase-like enolase superfamily enzyme
MKIKDVKTALVNTGPWPTPIPKDYGWTLARAITDEGIEGYGMPACWRDHAEAWKLAANDAPKTLSRIAVRLESAPGRFACNSGQHRLPH